MVDPRAEELELVASRYGKWRAAFEAERERVLAALEARGLAEAVSRVEHVGSTSVRGLPAKDIVDLDVVVADDAVEAVSRAVAAEPGGTRFENSTGWQPVFADRGGQRFNVHVFGESDPGWKISVATRAVLRADPELRDEYEALKRELVCEHDDLEAYSRGKSQFVDELLAAARARDEVDLEFPVPSVSDR